MDLDVHVKARGRTVSPEARLELLERRLEVLEAESEIRRLLASYGPAVDSDSRGAASRLWSEGGVYDVDVGTWEGRAAISDMLGSDSHQTHLARGCAHQVSISRVVVDGDRATATGYMQLIERGEEGFRILRQTAQRWELVRADGRWWIERRVGRLLDGRPESRELLRRGVDE